MLTDKMKKFLVAILAFAYLGTSTGAMVSMQFCMGKFANWTFGNDDSKTCGKCGMEKKSNGGCCQDDHRFLKSSPDQKITELSFNEVRLFTAVVPAPLFKINDVVLSRTIEESPTGHAPPLNHSISIYILTCDYRI